MSIKDFIEGVIKAKQMDPELTVKEDGTIVKEISLKSSSRGRTQADYMPTEDELAIILESAKIDYPKEAFRVFEFQAADQEIDRQFERFTPSGLKEMAEIAKRDKIPFLTEGDEDHQWRQKNIYGIVFDAYVKNQTLVYKVYIPVNERTEDVLESVFNGLYNKLSIGAALDPEKYICSACTKSLFDRSCPHHPGQIMEDSVPVVGIIKGVKGNYEISGVAVPAQVNSHVLSQSLGDLAEAGKEFQKSIEGIAEVLKNSTLDTMNNGTDTIKDSSMEKNETTEAVKDETVVTTTKSEEASENVQKTEDEATTPAGVASIDDLAALKTMVSEALATFTTKQEVEVKVDSTEIVEVVKSLEAKLDAVVAGLSKMEALEAQLKDLSQKVDVASSVSTDAVAKALLTQFPVEGEAEVETKKQVEQENGSWLFDYFGRDLGGQKQ